MIKINSSKLLGANQSPLQSELANDSELHLEEYIPKAKI